MVDTTLDAGETETKSMSMVVDTALDTNEPASKEVDDTVSEVTPVKKNQKSSCLSVLVEIIESYIYTCISLYYIFQSTSSCQ